MFISIDKNDKLPISAQLYRYFKDAILQGIIQSSSKMPSTRALGQELGIARSTVVECYEQLVAEGYLYGIEGSGTYVSDGLVFEVNNPKYNNLEQLADRPIYQLPEDYISFRSGVPDLRTVPIEQWGKLYRNVTIAASPDQLDYNSVFGDWSLRSALTSYLRRVRGVETTTANILITGGAAQAFSLLSELIKADDYIVIEEPASAGMVKTFKSHHVTCRPVAVDEQGLVTELLPSESPRFIITTPSHQFPMGNIMSIKRRIELIKYAKENQSYIVEDDYDSEFRYEGNLIQSMQSLAPEQVIYVGTFSKTFMPAIRMAYMVLPNELIEKMKQLKYASDLHSPILEQMTMARFIEEGMMDRHIHRMAKLYSKRRQLLVTLLRETFGDKIIISGDSAGLHFIVTFKEISDSHTFVERLKKEKVELIPVSDCCSNQESAKANQFILGFGNIQEDEIKEGIRRIKKAFLS